MTVLEYFKARLRLMLRRCTLEWLLTSDEKAAIALYAASEPNQPGRKVVKPFPEHDAVRRMFKNTEWSEEAIANDPTRWPSAEETDIYNRVREQVDVWESPQYCVDTPLIEAWGGEYDLVTFRRKQAHLAHEMRMRGETTEAICRATYFTPEEQAADAARY